MVFMQGVKTGKTTYKTYDNTSHTTYCAMRDEREEVISMIHMMKVFYNKLETMVNNKCCRQGVTLSQLEVLVYLSRNGRKEIYANEIEEHFKIRNSTSSGILIRMEEKRLITREKAQTDKRKKLVRITGKGEDILRFITKERENELRGICKNLTNEEREISRQAMEKMITNLENYKEDETDALRN